jgi:hypothetical protein
MRKSWRWRKKPSARRHHDGFRFSRIAMARPLPEMRSTIAVTASRGEPRGYTQTVPPFLMAASFTTRLPAVLKANNWECNRSLGGLSISKFLADIIVSVLLLRTYFALILAFAASMIRLH